MMKGIQTKTNLFSKFANNIFFFQIVHYYNFYVMCLV